MDERNISMLTQSIRITSFIFIQKQKTYGISYTQTIPILLKNLNCECEIDIFAPKVFISLRLLLFRYENNIQNPTFPFPSNFFHFDTKVISCFILKRKTHLMPQLYTLPVFQNNSVWTGKVTPFHNSSYPFVYFIDVRISVENPNYTLLIPCLSLWSKRNSFSQSITSFSYIFVLFGVS